MPWRVSPISGGARGDALYAGGCGGWALLPEAMRRVLLCMLEVVEGRLCLLEVLEVMRCMLETSEGGLCLLEVLEMPKAWEVMRCVLLCMLEVAEVIRGVLLCMLEAAEGAFCLRR